MSTGLKLRSYLEGREDITLAILRKLLRCHFREKDTTKLYQELCNLTQQANETPQEFVFRALDLRQKVGFSSQEDGPMLAYNQSLVQSMFLHAVGTGLSDASIAQELKPFLTKQGILDEVLLEQVNLAVRDELERQQKIASKKK
ncbi:hypothetical protein HOLleu_26750 [Holothuria leucospilota]|uniref:Uncharacterized protein n=1 Tax=Holothuria leucospilota TaxID=206669 RepID=A0A9Q1BPF2_HOLLE|nr:hypothetical protein HOLleu_26750 [Holothuria leucospilota]